MNVRNRTIKADISEFSAALAVSAQPLRSSSLQLLENVQVLQGWMGNVPAAGPGSVQAAGHERGASPGSRRHANQECEAPPPASF